MASQRIATNLLGAVVTPRSDTAADDYWPRTWPALPVGGNNPVQGKCAEVVAVYLEDGHVHFLVRNVVDGKMVETLADAWRVVAMPH